MQCKVVHLHPGVVRWASGVVHRMTNICALGIIKMVLVVFMYTTCRGLQPLAAVRGSFGPKGDFAGRTDKDGKLVGQTTNLRELD